MNVKGWMLCLAALLALLIPSESGGQEREYWPTVEWRTSEPEQQGVDSAILDRLTAYVKEQLRSASSVVAARRGFIIYERYFRGEPRDVRMTYSATKGILSALVGIALQEGYIKSLD